MRNRGRSRAEGGSRPEPIKCDSTFGWRRASLISLELLSQTDLVGVVRDLIQEVTRLRLENEKLSVALGKLRVEHQAAKDELARLKHLPPRPPIKPSGMDKATDAKGPEGRGGEKGGRSTQRRGSQLDKLTIGATVVVRAKAPAGSRHKGYEDIVVQDLSLKPTVTRYRRERWETPDGETIVANLNSGIVGGYGPNLNRLVLALHFAGQMSPASGSSRCSMAMGVVISKRQVRSPADGQAGRGSGPDGCGGVEGGLERRLCHGRRYGGAPRRQERLHHADRLFQLHRVSHRALQVAAGVSVAALRRNVALGDQRGRARLYERARSVRADP